MSDVLDSSFLRETAKVVVLPSAEVRGWPSDKALVYPVVDLHTALSRNYESAACFPAYHIVGKDFCPRINLEGFDELERSSSNVSQDDLDSLYEVPEELRGYDKYTKLLGKPRFSYLVIDCDYKLLSDAFREKITKSRWVELCKYQLDSTDLKEKFVMYETRGGFRLLVRILPTTLDKYKQLLATFRVMVPALCQVVSNSVDWHVPATGLMFLPHATRVIEGDLKSALPIDLPIYNLEIANELPTVNSILKKFAKDNLSLFEKALKKISRISESLEESDSSKKPSDMTPEELYLAIARAKPKDKKFELPERIEEGDRTLQMFAYACSLLGKGKSPEETIAEVVRVNSERVFPPLSDGELSSLLRSAIGKEKAKQKRIEREHNEQVSGILDRQSTKQLVSANKSGDSSLVLQYLDDLEIEGVSGADNELDDIQLTTSDKSNYAPSALDGLVFGGNIRAAGDTQVVGGKLVKPKKIVASSVVPQMEDSNDSMLFSTPSEVPPATEDLVESVVNVVDEDDLEDGVIGPDSFVMPLTQGGVPVIQFRDAIHKKSRLRKTREMLMFTHYSETTVAKWVASEISAKENLEDVLADRGSVWRYDNNYWQMIKNSDLISLICTLDQSIIRKITMKGPVLSKATITSKFAANCVELLMSMLAPPTAVFDSPERLGVVFNNKFIYTERGQNEVKSKVPEPSDYCTMRIPGKYTEEEPVLFNKFLSVIMAGDESEAKIQFIWEFIGVCLLGQATQLQTALILFGKGENGKSTLIRIIAGLFPEGKTTTISPQDLKNEYRSAMLAGSYLNYREELSPKSIGDEDQLKALIDGATETGRHIRGHPFNYTALAGQLFAVNKLPRFTDFTHGFLRKFVILNLQVQLKEQFTPERGFDKKILSLERTKIAAKALREGTKAIRRGSYVIPASSDNIKTKWRIRNDHVALFVASMCVRVDSGHTPPGTATTAVYSMYKVWAGSNNFTPVNVSDFQDRLEIVGVPEIQVSGVSMYPLLVKM